VVVLFALPPRRRCPNDIIYSTNYSFTAPHQHNDHRSFSADTRNKYSCSFFGAGVLFRVVACFWRGGHVRYVLDCRFLILLTTCLQYYARSQVFLFANHHLDARTTTARKRVGCSFWGIATLSCPHSVNELARMLILWMLVLWHCGSFSPTRPLCISHTRNATTMPENDYSFSVIIVVHHHPQRTSTIGRSQQWWSFSRSFGVQATVT